MRECPKCGEMTRKFVRAVGGVWSEYRYCTCGWSGPETRQTLSERLQGRADQDERT